MKLPNVIGALLITCQRALKEQGGTVFEERPEWPHFCGCEKPKEVKTMDVVKTTEIARALYRAHGDKAEIEAARCENQFKQAGDAEEAKNWRAIRGSIRRMRGANQS